MPKALTVSEAEPQLGKLLDKVDKGLPVYLCRKERLYRIELVAEAEPPHGRFAVDRNDPSVELANAAPASFISIE